MKGLPERVHTADGQRGSCRSSLRTQPPRQRAAVDSSRQFATLDEKSHQADGSPPLRSGIMKAPTLARVAIASFSGSFLVVSMVIGFGLASCTTSPDAMG